MEVVLVGGVGEGDGGPVESRPRRAELVGSQGGIGGQDPRTSRCSWDRNGLNSTGVERWFRELTGKAIRRGTFPSVDHLIAVIDDYLDKHNADPKPFTGRQRRVDHREGRKRACQGSDRVNEEIPH